MVNFEKVKSNEFKISPFKLIGTDWMLIAAEKDGKVNAMTASWGGLGVMWHKDVAFTVIRPQRYTKEFVDSSDSFSITFFDESYKKKLSYFGRVSGREEDKIKNSQLSLNFENSVPYFEEAAIVMICKKLYSQRLDPENFIVESINDEFYKSNDHHVLYISEIQEIFVKK